MRRGCQHHPLPDRSLPVFCGTATHLPRSGELSLRSPKRAWSSRVNHTDLSEARSSSPIPRAIRRYHHAESVNSHRRGHDDLIAGAWVRSVVNGFRSGCRDVAGAPPEESLILSRARAIPLTRGMCTDRLRGVPQPGRPQHALHRHRPGPPDGARPPPHPCVAARRRAAWRCTWPGCIDWSHHSVEIVLVDGKQWLKRSGQRQDAMTTPDAPSAAPD